MLTTILKDSWFCLDEETIKHVNSFRAKDKDRIHGIPKWFWDEHMSDLQRKNILDKFNKLPKERKLPKQYDKAIALKISQEEEIEDVVPSIISMVRTWYGPIMDLPEGNVSINNIKVNACFVHNKFSHGVYISIMDGGADTSVIGQGWTITAYDQFRRLNIVGLDSDKARKLGLYIVTAIFAVDIQGQLSLIHI